MMKKITLFIFLLTSYLGISQNDINFDANASWSGFMNVANLPTPYGDGGYQFGSSWGVVDLIAELDMVMNSVTLKPNRVNDSDSYWQTGDLTGNKIMDANMYIEDSNLRGSMFTFNGSVDSNTLNNTGLYSGLDFIVIAFIKVFNSDFSSLLDQSTIDLRSTNGNFALSMDATAYNTDQNIQYGFQFIGPNINNNGSYDLAYDTLGSIVIGPNSTLSVADSNISRFNVYPNPTTDSWNVITSNEKINAIQVYDILGKNVLSLTPYSTEAKIDASTLKSGLYFAKVSSSSGTQSMKLIRR